MDANGTRYHLLLGQRDWGALDGGASPPDDASPPDGRESVASDDLEWDDRSGEVRLRQKAFRFVGSLDERPLNLDDRRGSARDRYGTWYWIERAQRSIVALSSGSRTISTFWPVSPTASEDVAAEGAFHACAPVTLPPAPELRGLCITEDHYLVAGVVDPPGLLVFDLYAGGPPRQRTWPVDSLVPFGLAAREGGGVWILDRDLRHVWEMDRAFDVVPSHANAAALPNERDGDFVAAGGGADRADGPARAPSTADAWTLPATSMPIAITALPGHGVLVLDRQKQPSDETRLDSPPTAATDDTQFAQILWLEDGRIRGTASTRVMVRLASGPGEAPFALVAHDFALVPGAADQEPHRLYVAARDGNQAYAFDVTTAGGALALSPVADYFPMRLFGGRALVVADDKAWYDCGDRWVPLTEQKRPRFTESGELLTRVFDSGLPQCVWHRLMLDGCIPPGTSVDVWTRAAEQTSDLTNATWRLEPRPYRRGAGTELPYVPNDYRDSRGTWELLFQDARGRYLQIRLLLSGDRRRTPRLRALRAWYPRFSYLDHYLPSVYREDVPSAHFLDRFLANFEGLFTAIEDRIAAAQMLFDATTAPPETLDWLATWFGVALDPSWTEDRRRLFLHHAMDFFAARGTARGIEMALRLALDRCVDESLFAAPSSSASSRTARVVEGFRGRLPGEITGDVDAAVARLGDRRLVSQLWRDFLARRYRSVQTLNTAWPAAWNAFAEIELPKPLPSTGTMRADWLDFESAVLATQSAAHRFTVMIPVRPHVRTDDPTPQQRLALARTVLDLEKPAHTAYDIRYYWAAFRLGGARLGDDTLVDQGSRSPELMPPMTLGAGYLAEAFLAAHPGAEAPARLAIGRDRVGRSARLGGP
jgi:phage tail-like protein